VAELLLFACENCRFVKFELPTVTTAEVIRDTIPAPTCAECNCVLTPSMKHANFFVCDECFDRFLGCAEPPADDSPDRPAEKETAD
jgi:hypothetical protein